MEFSSLYFLYLFLPLTLLVYFLVPGLRLKNIVLLEAGSNGTEIVALIRRMSLVIAMRLHTLIFAAGQGVPMVGVVYDPKVSGFLDYLGQDLYLPLEEASAASLCDLIDTAMAEQMFEAENIRSLRELAAENEELARHLLTEE